MKRTILLTVTIAAFLFMSFAVAKFHTDIYKVDAASSWLEWHSEKAKGKHNGTIMISGGEIQNNHGHLKGSLEFDMNSIISKDIADEKSKKKLEKQMKSVDFFDTEKHPKAAFVFISVTPITVQNEAGYTHNVKGNLTIRDTTNEISFDATIKFIDNKISLVGSSVVDLSKYTIRNDSKSLNADIGDDLFYDQFTIKFNVVAVK